MQIKPNGWLKRIFGKWCQLVPHDDNVKFDPELCCTATTSSRPLYNCCMWLVMRSFFTCVRCRSNIDARFTMVFLPFWSHAAVFSLTSEFSGACRPSCFSMFTICIRQHVVQSKKRQIRQQNRNPKKQTIVRWYQKPDAQTLGEKPNAKVQPRIIVMNFLQLLWRQN